MSIDIQEPDTKTIINYENFALEIKEAMTKYRELRSTFKGLGLHLSANHQRKSTNVLKRASAGMTPKAAKLVSETICKIQGFAFTGLDEESKMASGDCIGHITGYSDLQVRYGWPIELEDSLIVVPYCENEQQPHSSHFLTPLATEVGTVSDIIGRVGDYQIIIPCGDMSYIEIYPWAAEMQIEHRDSPQEQVLAYLYWVCFGNGNVDMNLLEKFVEAHKAEEIGAERRNTADEQRKTNEECNDEIGAEHSEAEVKNA